jgi:hypothetical protein
MALIKCPECGQMVSDQADVCIHCGYPLRKKPVDHFVLVVIHQDSEHECTSCKFDGKLVSSSDSSFESEPGEHVLELLDVNEDISETGDMRKNKFSIPGEARRFDIYLKYETYDFSSQDGPFGYRFIVDRMTYSN